MIQQRALSLVDKLNQKKVQDRIKSLYLNKEKSGPWVIELDPTTACNLACHDCISANLLNQGGIDSERLLKLASEFKEIGVKAVVLIGGGEPMAHKEFGKLVEVGNSKALSEAILYAFKNQSDMLLKVKKSENYMKKFYTENVVNEYKKLLTNEHR